MTEGNRYSTLEQELDVLYAAPLSEPFVNSLKLQLNSKIRIQPKAAVRTLRLRPAWIMMICVFAVIILATLVIGPAKVYAGVQRLLGYIPGVGLVDSSAPIRVLAEPVEQTRDGLTITVTSATLTADRTQIDYRIFGVPRSAYPDREDVTGCMETDYLLLPDGTRIDRTSDMLPVPADVNEATLVIPCIGNTLPGSAPEDWRLPLKFVPAPPNFTVMPVLEVDPELTATAEEPSQTQTTQKPVADDTMRVNQVIDTETGYILIGEFAPETTPGEWAQTTGMPVITDANGMNVPYLLKPDIDAGGGGLMNGGFGWAYQFDAAGVVFPIRISVSSVIISSSTSGESVEMPFDFGESVAAGQEWQVGKTINLDGHSLTLTTITATSRGYSFAFECDPNVNGIGVEITGHTSVGGGGGGGGGLTDGKFNRSIAYASLPTGEVTLRFFALSLISEPQTWEAVWSPETERSDIPSQNILADGTCANANSIQSAAEIPTSISGKVLVYEEIPDMGQWGLVLYNLDGSGRTIVKPSGSWGAFSADGSKIIYPVEGGFEVYDVASGLAAVHPGSGMYNPVWSNDGSRFAFVRGAAEGVSVVDLITGAETQVSSLGYETVVGWLPDDSRLIIAAMYTGGAARQIRSIDLQTRAYEELFIVENASAKAINAVLSPDGQWMVYRGRDNGSVYMVRLDGSDERLLLDSMAMDVSGIAWSRSGWMGVSMQKEYNQTTQRVVLIDPQDCTVYHLPGVTGTLTGLFIQK